MLSILLIIIGFLICLVGLAGSILPVIPGPLVSFLSLIILNWAKDGQAFSFLFLLAMAALAIIMTFLDYVVSMAGAQKYGASKAGLWGSVAGMIIGILFFPPLGIFIGALAGAVVGEVLDGKQTRQAVRVGWGVLVGNFVGLVLKLAYSLMIFFFFIIKIL